MPRPPHTQPSSSLTLYASPQPYDRIAIRRPFLDRTRASRARALSLGKVLTRSRQHASRTNRFDQAHQKNTALVELRLGAGGAGPDPARGSRRQGHAANCFLPSTTLSAAMVTVSVST